MPAGTFERAAAMAERDDCALEKPRIQSEIRKSSKPIMEKRRRARINESLGHLKTLILDALKKDSSRHSKLEKADILEMTVKHLRNLQRLQMTAAVTSDPSVMGKYRAGFSECVGEVTRFLSTCEGVTTEVRTRLLGHLASCVTQINGVNFYTPHPTGLAQTPSYSGVPPQNPCKSGPSLQAPPDAMKVYGGFKVVPTPDGQFALLVPSAALSPAQGCHMSPLAPPLTSDPVWRPW